MTKPAAGMACGLLIFNIFSDVHRAVITAVA